MSVWAWRLIELAAFLLAWAGTLATIIINRRTRRMMGARMAAAIAERDAWPNCRITLVVDGHPYVNATLLQLQTVHCDGNWLEPGGELPPMVLVSRPGVELTLLQVPPFLPIRTDAVPPAEPTGRRRPFGG